MKALVRLVRVAREDSILKTVLVGIVSRGQRREDSIDVRFVTALV